MSWMSRWFPWMDRKSGRRPDRAALRLARAAAREIGFPWKESGPGVWSVLGENRHGFQVELQLFIEGNLVVCMVRAGIKVHRPWVLRAFAIRLLEENNRYVHGSNRLLEQPDGMSVLHCHACDSTKFTAGEVAQIGRILIRQMEQLVSRLHAEGLVIRTEPNSRVLELG